jgi:formylglycine-generating enzyme required for sulfatase activity
MNRFRPRGLGWLLPAIGFDTQRSRFYALGLYDMSGNVWEWTYDWHPNWIGSKRIIRGGSYNSTSNHLQIGGFTSTFVYVASSENGFRILRKP